MCSGETGGGGNYFTPAVVSIFCPQNNPIMVATVQAATAGKLGVDNGDLLAVQVCVSLIVTLAVHRCVAMCVYLCMYTWHVCLIDLCVFVYVPIYLSVTIGRRLSGTQLRVSNGLLDYVCICECG